MNDLKNHRHGDEGVGSTHWSCNKRLKKEGGYAECCDCYPHNNCGDLPKENQPQSVEGLEDKIVEQFLKIAHREYIPREWYCPTEALNYLRKEIRQLLTHQQSEVLETVRKTIQEKKVANDFAKRHPESYKYELGWDAALDDILNSLSNNKS